MIVRLEDGSIRIIPFGGNLRGLRIKSVEIFHNEVNFSERDRIFWMEIPLRFVPPPSKPDPNDAVPDTVIYKKDE